MACSIVLSLTSESPAMNAPLHREIPSRILNAAQVLSQVTTQWDRDIVQQLTDYIAIP